MDDRHAFVMMIQEKWWNEFRQRQFDGKDVHSYVQKGKAPPKNTMMILFYVSKPIGKLAGYGEFVERVVGEAEKVWKKHGTESVLKSKEKFDEFLGDYRTVSFIRFKNLREATKPIPLANVLAHLGVKRLSRKGFYVNKETSSKLISMMA